MSSRDTESTRPCHLTPTFPLSCSVVFTTSKYSPTFSRHNFWNIDFFFKHSSLIFCEFFFWNIDSPRSSKELPIIYGEIQAAFLNDVRAFRCKFLIVIRALARAVVQMTMGGGHAGDGREDEDDFPPCAVLSHCTSRS